MLDVVIVHKTFPEANWNRQAGRQADGRTGKPMCREAAPPKTPILTTLQNSFPQKIKNTKKC